jgi:uncharacterized membrane protein YdjX (TVP38/TMEM64 family)
MRTTSPTALDRTAGRSQAVMRIAALVFVAIGLVAAQQTGLFRLLGDPARATQALVDLGPWGKVAFVATYAALQPFGVAGTAFVLLATLVWPWPVAFGLSMAGTLSASVVGFSLARFVARDWVARRVPARFHAYDEVLAERGLRTVAAMRLVFTMHPMLHAFFGVSRVSFWTHFWGSAAGYALPVLAIVYFGEKLFEALRDAPLSVWVGVGLTAAAIALAVKLIRSQRRVRS